MDSTKLEDAEKLAQAEAEKERTKKLQQAYQGTQETWMGIKERRRKIAQNIRELQVENETLSMIESTLERVLG